LLGIFSDLGFNAFLSFVLHRGEFKSNHQKTPTKGMFLENSRNKSTKKGWIEVICGSMFSGKTEELIRRLKRAQFAKQKVEIFKPAVDTRYDETEVVSHDANAIQSTPVPILPIF